jgi:hypothetical protein
MKLKRGLDFAGRNNIVKVRKIRCFGKYFHVLQALCELLLTYYDLASNNLLGERQ